MHAPVRLVAKREGKIQWACKEVGYFLAGQRFSKFTDVYVRERGGGQLINLSPFYEWPFLESVLSLLFETARCFLAIEFHRWKNGNNPVHLEKQKIAFV